LALHPGAARFSPHDLRRNFVSDLLDDAADPAAANQALAGHGRPEAVRYDRRPDTARRRAAPSSTTSPYTADRVKAPPARGAL